MAVFSLSCNHTIQYAFDTFHDAYACYMGPFIKDVKKNSEMFDPFVTFRPASSEDACFIT